MCASPLPVIEHTETKTVPIQYFPTEKIASYGSVPDGGMQSKVCVDSPHTRAMLFGFSSFYGDVDYDLMTSFVVQFR